MGYSVSLRQKYYFYKVFELIMRLKCAFVLILVFACSAVEGHPLHLTFTNLEFNTKNSHWILTVKAFSDDFASDLKLVAGTGAVIDNKMKTSEIEQILKKWLEPGLRIWFDSRQIDFGAWKFDGIRVKDDATWLTYIITAPLPLSEIKIRNTLLFDLYADQKNLFILTMGQFQSAHEFKNKDQETVIMLNK